MPLYELAESAIDLASIDRCTLAVAALATWLWAYFRRRRRRRRSAPGAPGSRRSAARLPPGPAGWPLVGHLWSLGDSPHVTLTELSRKYGDVFTLRLGSLSAVVVSGSDVIRELARRGAAFGDRPQFRSFRHYAGGTSISFSPYCHRLRLHRRIAATALRHLADGRLMDTERVLRREFSSMADAWRSRRSGFDPAADVTLLVASLLYSFCFGDHFRLSEDPDYVRLLTSTNPTTELFGVGSHVEMMPWLRALSKRSQVASAARRMKEFLLLNTRQVARWKALGNSGGIVGCLLSLWERRLEEPTASRPLTRKHIENTPIEFLSAGTETSTASLLWLLLYMAKYPDVQRRAQAELDDVIGDGAIRIGDQQRLPYTEACVMEVMRLVAIVPFGLPRATTADVTVGDYVIPRGTLILMNLWSAGRDERVWRQPDRFRPERFLTRSPGGAATIDRRPLGRYFPFGAGSRSCVGERLGRMQVFYVFSSILRAFTVTLDGDPEADVPPVFGDVMKPSKYRIRVVARR